MDSVPLEFLRKERICVISVVLADGSPHVATVHYSEQSDPVKVFIQTFPTIKTEAIQEKGGRAKAAAVVGFSEQDMTTLQMRGDVRIVSNSAEQEAIFKIHYTKHPQAAKYRDEETILLEFSPTWWRYTNLKNPSENSTSDAE